MTTTRSSRSLTIWCGDVVQMFAGAAVIHRGYCGAAPVGAAMAAIATTIPLFRKEVCSLSDSRHTAFRDPGVVVLKKNDAVTRHRPQHSL